MRTIVLSHRGGGIDLAKRLSSFAFRFGDWLRRFNFTRCLCHRDSRRYTFWIGRSFGAGRNWPEIFTQWNLELVKSVAHGLLSPLKHLCYRGRSAAGLGQ
jgi:hypothetical protein